MPLTIETRHLGDVTVLECTGHLRLGETSSAFRNTFRETVKAGATKVLIDLAGVDYMDSTGIGELVGAHSIAASSGARIKLVRLPEKVANLLRLTRLCTVFQIHEDVDEAASAF
jgi:anti-sigma B factor antagonist